MTISEPAGLTRRQFLGHAALGMAAFGLAAPARADDRLSLLGLEEHFATPKLQRLNNIRFPKGVPHFDITLSSQTRRNDPSVRKPGRSR